MSPTTPKAHTGTDLKAELRRWILGVGVAVIAVVVMVYQGKTVSRLRLETDALRAASSETEALRLQNQDYRTLAAENSDLDRLRRDAAELETLRRDVENLRQQLQEIETLQAENQQLRSRLAQAAPPATPPDSNAQSLNTAGEVNDEALSTACINNLKQIGLAVRIWATDNQDRFPTSFTQMSNELSTPIILLCPADTARQAQRQSIEAQRAALERARPGSAAFTLFSRLGPSFPSYQLHLSGEADDRFPQRILSQCPVHGHIGLTDGSVQSDPIGAGIGRQEVIDGRLTLVPTNPDPISLDPETRRLMIERYGLSPEVFGESESTDQPQPEAPDPETLRLLQERYGLTPEQMRELENP